MIKILFINKILELLHLFYQFQEINEFFSDVCVSLSLCFYVRRSIAFWSAKAETRLATTITEMFSGFVWREDELWTAWSRHNVATFTTCRRRSRIVQGPESGRNVQYEGRRNDCVQRYPHELQSPNSYIIIEITTVITFQENIIGNWRTMA